MNPWGQDLLRRLALASFGGYSYFRDLPIPGPQDDSSRSRKGDFAALFIHSARCSHKYSKAKKLTTFSNALLVDRHVLLGDSPPESILEIYNPSHSDLLRKGRWKLDSIALSIHNLSKFVHERIKAHEGLAPLNPRITALTVMYEYFDAKVTQIEKERESDIAAVRTSMVKTTRNPLPSGFKFDPDMVSLLGYGCDGERSSHTSSGGAGDVDVASREEWREDGRGGGARRRR